MVDLLATLIPLVQGYQMLNQHKQQEQLLQYHHHHPQLLVEHHHLRHLARLRRLVHRHQRVFQVHRHHHLPVSHQGLCSLEACWQRLWVERIS